MSEVAPAKSLWSRFKTKLVAGSLCAVFALSAGSAFAHENEAEQENSFYDPVAPALLCQHFSEVSTFDSLPDEQKEKTARERLATGKFLEPEKPNRQNVCSKLAYLDALYINGLDDAEKKLHRETLEQWTRGENQKFFADMLNQDIREISQILMKDPVFMAAFNRYALTKSYSMKQQGQGPVLTQDELQHISNVIRTYYDLPLTTTVRYAKMKDENVNGMNYDTFWIGYFARWDTIEINPALSTDFFAVIRTLSHETRHSVDGDLINLLRRGVLPLDSPRALYAAILAANLHNYSSSSEEGEEAYMNYYNQPMENYAFLFGPALSETLEDELYSLKNSPFMLKADTPRVLNLV